MHVIIKSEIFKKLEEIGFEKDEINAIEFIHGLRIGKYSNDITALVKTGVSANIRKELLDKIKELSWEMGEKTFGNREDLYDRQYRDLEGLKDLQGLLLSLMYMGYCPATEFYVRFSIRSFIMKKSVIPYLLIFTIVLQGYAYAELTSWIGEKICKAMGGKEVIVIHFWFFTV